MKFKYSAFTENTPEMMGWLDKLGYEPYNIPPFGVIIDRMPDADINCLNCFWKDAQQLRRNFDTDESIMLWSMIQEELIGYTFKEKLSFRQIRELPIQLDFFEGVGAGCQAGFCTN